MRIIYIFVGLTSLALGFAGIFLPLLPTTPFVLLSAFCFARSSPRLYQWMIENRWFGATILQWQKHRTVSPAVKKRAILLVTTSFSITILFFIDQTYLQFLLIFTAVVLIIYLYNLPSTAPVSVSDKSDT